MRKREVADWIVRERRQSSGTKEGCANNNFTFLHLIFGASLFDPQSQNPRNSDAITAVLLNRIEQI